MVAESTAWATQLRLLAPTILAKLRAAGRRGRRDPVARCRSDGPQLEEGAAHGARPGAARHLRMKDAVPATVGDGPMHGGRSGDRTGGRRASDRCSRWTTPAPPTERPGDPSGEGGWQEPAHLGPQGEGAGHLGPAPEDPPPARHRCARDRPVRAGGDPVLGAFAHRGDPWGVQGWALRRGWRSRTGRGRATPSSPSCSPAARCAPGKEARPSGVIRGRAGTLELVAFDIV